MAINNEKIKEEDLKLDIEEMAKAGLHFGHRVSNTNPKMKPYIFGVRNSMHILDLEKTSEKLKEAVKFIQKLISEGKVLLVVGTKIQINSLVKDFAKECDLPYVSERWLGGTFTNFETISKRIAFFKDLERKKQTGELEKYTKKERSQFDQKLKDFENKFGGIKDLGRLPDAILILDMKKDEIAVREAKNVGIKIIGITHTNVDPTLADFPIPANDDAISSVKYILDKIKEAIQKVRPNPKS
ncbi:MAG: 30S ribosomal protein S2 [Candidatus Pacebacteria bacterium]|nr:30S ribosomal protein S2 [Candidatus Paceibacterota bacterium]